MICPSSSVMLIEFNELTPKLIEKFMRSGYLPNFKQFYDEAHIYLTDAEEDGEALNPWVQWVTVHSGLSASEHGITSLSDGHKLKTKAIWDLLSEAGFRVWVCGSMNVCYDKPLNGYLLPDPWATGLQPYPDKEFDAYYKFVRCAVQEHTNSAFALSKLDMLKFALFMLTHGLSLSTVRGILTQLWTERITGKYHWKRATLMDRFQWDIFQNYYRKYEPHFCTFFLNSTAHFQHTYWRHMEPEVFTVRPSLGDHEEHQYAILYGYQNMDDLLGRFLKLAESDITLIFCTGLSQQPYLKAEAAGGRHYYRIKHPTVLTERLGLKGNYTYHPIMAEQFVLRFADLVTARQAHKVLQKYRVGSRSAFHSSLQGSDLTVQCTQTEMLPANTVIMTENSTQTIPFFDIFYRMDNLKSGYHHPDGILWIRRPDREHIVHTQRIPLHSIAPTILDMYNIPQPDFMTSKPFANMEILISKL